MNPTLLLTPQKRGILIDGGTLELLIHLQAPAPPETTRQRPALQLALVLDRSGSMAGAPLEEAKHCAQMVVERLTARDRAAVVVFDNTIQTLVALRTVESPTPFQRALQSVVSGGNTALHGGWLQGAKELSAYTETGASSRVILLSDGQANQGTTDPEAIFAQCARMAEAGITTTTIGLGRSFNEDLMMGMAQQGRGKSYYGQRAEDLFDAFCEELDLMEALHSREVTLNLVPGPGVIVEVLSQDDVRADGPLRLSDLAYGSETWLLVRLHYGAKPAGMHALLSVTASGKLAEGGSYTLGPALLEVPSLGREQWDSLPTDERVQRRSGEATTARLLLTFRRCLERGDRAGAEAALVEARVLGETNQWIADSIVELERLLEQDAALASKEARYKSQHMQTRLSAPMEQSYVADETAGLDLPTFLRRKGSQGRGG